MPFKFQTLPTLERLGVSPIDLSSATKQAQSIASDVFESFTQHIQSRDADKVVSLFVDVSPSWRDMLALSWELRTKTGKDEIHDFLSTYITRSQFGSLELKPTAKLAQPYPDLVWIVAEFSFTTEHGIGSGILRLVPIAYRSGIQWKIHGVYTNLEGFKNFPERIGSLREQLPTHGEWETRRAKELEVSQDPQVLIIGGAQNGLAVAARLKYLGVSALVVDKKQRVGDSWRGRYNALSLHDPVWYDHLPYLPFPPTWPVYPAAGKLADWLESYAKTLELNIWTSTEAKKAVRDPESGKWIVDVEREGYGPRTFRVNHIVLAVGIRGGVPKMPSYPGMDEFNGSVIHSTQYISAKDYVGKKVVVIGAATSGHDISGDLARHGIDVTMSQRNGTIVLGPESAKKLFGSYTENGPLADKADRLDASLPRNMVLSLARRFVKASNEVDRQLHDDLKAAGFRLSDGPDGTGAMGSFWARGGGYYFEHGTSRLIIDGSIQIKQGTPKRFMHDGIEFEDGSKLAADAVVYATGYDEPEVAFRPLLGDEVVSQMHPIWELDEEGEFKGLWRKLNVPGIWVMMGSLQIARFYSHHVALQIKAIEEGIIGPN